MADNYINPTTGLFSGLAEGFFGARREAERLAREDEDRTRDESLRTLTGLLDNATPETQPVLLRQIGDIMGIKGKERGIWDRLAGTGLTDTRDELQSRFQNILAGVVPQAEYEKLKRTPVGFRGGAAVGGFPTLTADTVDRSSGKVALRNPQQEALDKLTRQYSLKSAADELKLTESERLRLSRERELEELKQRGRIDLENQDAINKATELIRTRAATLPGGLADPRNIKIAQKQVAYKYGLDESLLEARTKYFGAKTDEAEANASFLQRGGGLKPGEVARLDLAKKQAGEQQRRAGESVYQRYSGAQSKADALAGQIRDAEARISQVMSKPGYKFDPSTGQLVNATTGQADPIATAVTAGLGGVAELMQKLPELKRQLAEFQGETKQAGEGLRAYPEFYREQAGKFSPIAEPPVGTPRVAPGQPATPTAPGTPGSGLVPRGGAARQQRIPDIGKRFRMRDSRTLRPGEIIEQGGMKFRVDSITPATRAEAPGIDKAYSVTRIE